MNDASKTPNEILDTFELQIKRLKDRTPEEIQADEKRRFDEQQEMKRFRVAAIRDGWNAPKRHVQRRVQMSGEWASRLNTVKEMIGKGVLIGLVGGRGTGKTQLAVELMRYTTEMEQKALFVSAIEFFMHIKETYNRDSELTEADVIYRFTRPKLLVIDEIGKRGNSDWENNLLFEAINQRYNDMKDTVLIDNRSKAEFIETIGPSLSSRMNEGGGILECNWNSFRE